MEVTNTGVKKDNEKKEAHSIYLLEIKLCFSIRLGVIGRRDRTIPK